MSDASVPVEIPLIQRNKAELVRHIGRLEDNLKWYVDERNRLLKLGEELSHIQSASNDCECDLCDKLADKFRRFAIRDETKDRKSQERQDE